MQNYGMTMTLINKHNEETVKTYEVIHELPFTSGDEAEKAYEAFCKREGYTFDSRMSRKAFNDCHRYFRGDYAVGLINDCKRFIQFATDTEFTKREVIDGLLRGSLKVRKIQLTANGTAYLTFFRRPTVVTRLFNVLEWAFLSGAYADEEMAENINALIDELQDDPKRIATEIWNAWCDKCEEDNVDPNTGCINDLDDENAEWYEESVVNTPLQRNARKT